MAEMKKDKHWICVSCGNEVFSSEYPSLGVTLPWSDGHKCRYREVKEEGSHDGDKAKTQVL